MWKVLHVILISHYSFALDSITFFDPFNSLDVAPPAEYGITGNLGAASNIIIGITTGEPIDPQALNLFNNQAVDSDNKLVQLVSEGETSKCLPSTNLPPNNMRRRVKRGKEFCNSNLLEVSPGAGVKPTAPTEQFRENESGQQTQTDLNSESAPAKVSTPAKDPKEPSAGTETTSNNNPCKGFETYIHAVCSPLNLARDIEREDPRVARFMLPAANTCTCLDSAHFTLLHIFFLRNHKILFQSGERALENAA